MPRLEPPQRLVPRVCLKSPAVQIHASGRRPCARTRALRHAHPPAQALPVQRRVQAPPVCTRGWAQAPPVQRKFPSGVRGPNRSRPLAAPDHVSPGHRTRCTSRTTPSAHSRKSSESNEQSSERAASQLPLCRPSLVDVCHSPPVSPGALVDARRRCAVPVSLTKRSVSTPFVLPAPRWARRSLPFAAINSPLRLLLLHHRAPISVTTSRSTPASPS